MRGARLAWGLIEPHGNNDAGAGHLTRHEPSAIGLKDFPDVEIPVADWNIEARVLQGRRLNRG
jgi:hypothetical protein